MTGLIYIAVIILLAATANAAIAIRASNKLDRSNYGMAAVVAIIVAVAIIASLVVSELFS